jgi:SAM-dependent methyltransferase
MSLPEEPMQRALEHEAGSFVYAASRAEDPQIAAMVRAALGDAGSVVNIGAGTGSYEPSDVPVLAVEPSPLMIAQRPSEAAPVVEGVAEALPIADDAFDAALAALSTHHWDDVARGLGEMRRVARRRAVIFTCDPVAHDFWLYDYLPSALLSVWRRLPRLEVYEALGPIRVLPVPVPRDCRDGFVAAWWARPDAYLDPVIRANISAFLHVPADELRAGLDRLRTDLLSGAWERRHGPGDRESLDCGYRLVIAELGPGTPAAPPIEPGGR